MIESIYLPGEPIAQQRPRVFKSGGAFDPCFNAKLQNKEYIQTKYPSYKTATKPIHVTFIYVYEYPKSMPKKKRHTHFKQSRPDLDNLDKYIMDMGNGLLWEDDSLIVCMSSYKIYGQASSTMIQIDDALPEVFFQLNSSPMNINNLR